MIINDNTSTVKHYANLLTAIMEVTPTLVKATYINFQYQTTYSNQIHHTYRHHHMQNQFLLE